MFQAAKDAITSKAAQKWVNDFISRYGVVQELRIDSKQKTVVFTVQLKGEISPVSVSIGRYDVETEQGRAYVRASSFDCSRPWLKDVLNDHASNRRIELPSWAAAAL